MIATARRLDRFPNAERAQSVPEVDAQTISRREFWREFVCRNRPAVLRGAASGWAAHGWDTATIRGRLGGVENIFANDGFFVREPFGEYAGGSVSEIRRRLRRATPAMSARDFFHRMDESPFLTAYAVPLATAGFEQFNSGLGRFPFIDLENRRPRLASYLSRAFFNKGGYTDWHFHSTDETLTVQLLNRKELLLLPPDQPTFARMWSIVKDRPGWSITAESETEFRDVVPLRVVLEPGDAIYIPVFWWHACEALDNTMGATLAFTFASPWDVQLDPRFAGVRWNLRTAMSERKYRKAIPLLLLGACAAVMRHPLRPQYLQ